MVNSLSMVLGKIDLCIDYQALYAMEPDFNEVGLTVQTTSNKRMILCRIQDGKPLAESIIDHYIFIGTLEDSAREISERASEKIKSFVKQAAGERDEIKNIARSWKDGLRMYGQAVRLKEGEEKEGNVISEDKEYPLMEG